MGTDKYAVIDVGSNSVRLMIAQVQENGEVVPLHKEIAHCRLFQGLSHTMELSEAAMTRTVEAIQEMKVKAESYHVDAVYIFATAAVRDAANRDTFIRRVHKETNLLLDLLCREREAEAGFAGTYDPGPRGMIDIGGGSTELAVGLGDRTDAEISMKLGAVRALEIYPLGDIADEMTLAAMQQWASNTFKQEAQAMKAAWEALGKPGFSGVGGTITTLAAMDQRLTEYTSDKIQGYVLKLSAVNRILHRLCELPLTERKTLPGLQKERADIIIGGTVIVQQFMNFMDLQSIKVSDRDSLEGYLHLRLE